MGVVDQIKERLDIVELIGAYVPLQKAGRNWRAACPFHSERTPSFYVFPDSQRWHCFGACAEGGDIFTFVMKREGWDFYTALEELARRAGVELTPRTPAQLQAEEASDRLRAALVEAIRTYHHLLLHAPEAAVARTYLERRGLSAETVERFQLGYSLPGWESLRSHLTAQGFSVAELVDAGLLVAREDGTAFDRFRGRLMIPIYDARGRPVGFGARTLDPDGVPKYMNSPQSSLFDKSQTLFGLDKARDGIRREDCVVIVEGYMDVMQAHQAGFDNVVAQMGTALTEAQVRQLKRYARRFVLALDPDAAGVQATLRGLEVARETLDREWEPVFDPRGLVGFEGRLGAEIRILSLPAGYDPDDLIRADRERWTALLRDALPVVEFYLQTLLRGANLDDAKERGRILESMLPLLRDVADPAERETYAQKVARALRIEERTVTDQLRVARRKAPQPADATPPSGRVQADLEGYLLKALLARPPLLGQVNELLAERGIAPLRAQDFQDPASWAILRAWEQMLAEPSPDPRQLEQRLPEALGERLATLLAEPAELADEQWLREGMQAALRLRERNLRQVAAGLRLLIREAQEAGDSSGEERCVCALEENARAILLVQQVLRSREWLAPIGATVAEGRR